MSTLRVRRALAAVLFASSASAQQAAPPSPAAPQAASDGLYLHGFGALALGRGLRLNNPYRLATPLGDDAESLSLSATYLDLSAAAALGDPEGLQHGMSLHLSIALDGIPQEVLTPSYLALYPLPPYFFVYGRAGLPIVLEPDAAVGYELAAGGAWLFTAGVGATAELIGSLFYGAATQDEAVTLIPIISLQIGILIDLEVLP